MAQIATVLRNEKEREIVLYFRSHHDTPKYHILGYIYTTFTYAYIICMRICICICICVYVYMYILLLGFSCFTQDSSTSFPGVQLFVFQPAACLCSIAGSGGASGSGRVGISRSLKPLEFCYGLQRQGSCSGRTWPFFSLSTVGRVFRDYCVQRFAKTESCCWNSCLGSSNWKYQIRVFEVFHYWTGSAVFR